MPRKVLFVESGPGYGGSAFSLFRLVKSLDRSRYQPHAAVFYSARAFDDISSLGVPVEVLRFCQPLFACSPRDTTALQRARNYSSFYGNLLIDATYNGIKLARYIRHHEIDIVHLNNGIIENLCGVFAARLAHVPCVSHVRGTGWITKVERYFIRWVSAVITLNRFMLDHYVRVVGDNRRVHLICNGVDLDAFQNPNPQRIRQEFGIQPGTFAVGTFARLVDGKGIPEFIATAGRVSRAAADSQFFVVGSDSAEDGAFEARMRELARNMGLDGRLLFTGWRDDRIDAMAAMDLVLQISTTFPEGMSLAPLEAMALGKPVIVTDIPGYEFCVDDGTTGFMVAPGDIDALTEKVLILARDRTLTERMGQAGYRKALREFDVRLTAGEVQKIYDRLLFSTRPVG